MLRYIPLNLHAELSHSVAKVKVIGVGKEVSFFHATSITPRYTLCQ